MGRKRKFIPGHIRATRSDKKKAGDGSEDTEGPVNEDPLNEAAGLEGHNEPVTPELQNVASTSQGAPVTPILDDSAPVPGPSTSKTTTKTKRPLSSSEEDVPFHGFPTEQDEQGKEYLNCNVFHVISMFTYCHSVK